MAIDAQARGIAATAKAQSGLYSDISRYNNTRALPKFRLALARVRSGLGPRAKIAFIGTSNTQGARSDTNNGNTGRLARSWPQRTMDLLNAAGWASCHNDGTFGSANIDNSAGAFVAYDGRNVLNTWNYNVASAFSLGGPAIFNGVTPDTTTRSFTPTGAFDTIDLYFIKNTGAGTFTVNVDGGSTLATIDTSGTAALGKQTISVTKGTHTINIQRNGTGGTVWIIAIDCYDSTTPKVAFANMGWSGATSDNLSRNVNPWENISAYKSYAPDLAFVEIWTNDMGNGVAPATTVTNAQAIIDAVKVSGDVVLVGPPRYRVQNASQAVQDAMNATIKQLAVANNCPMFNLTEFWPEYNSAVAMGLMFDGLHPTNFGYLDWAGQAAAFLRQY